jgi:hypothetical protein
MRMEILKVLGRLLIGVADKYVELRLQILSSYNSLVVVPLFPCSLFRRQTVPTGGAALSILRTSALFLVLLLPLRAATSLALLPLHQVESENAWTLLVVEV